MYAHASCEKTFTWMDNFKRHMKQQHCDNGRKKNFFVHSIVMKVHFKHYYTAL